MQQLQFLFIVSFFLASVTNTGAQIFVRGELYNIITDVSYSDISECESSQWTLSELSDSWRIVNPFTGIALRAENGKIAKGESNGSDEAQLWKIVPAGEQWYYIYTANNTSLAWNKGDKRLFPKSQAR